MIFFLYIFWINKMMPQKVLHSFSLKYQLLSYTLHKSTYAITARVYAKTYTLTQTHTTEPQSQPQPVQNILFVSLHSYAGGSDVLEQ